MPKLIVLFFGDQALIPIAASAVAGAKSVRLTEVALRGGAGGAPQVAATHPIGECDGAVIVSAANGVAPELATLLDAWEQQPEVRDVVFGVIGSDALLGRVARLGGILVSERARADLAEGARALGARVAKVAGWVRHGLGHEADHSHRDHSHDDHAHHDHSSQAQHGHAHDHGHDHHHDEHR